MGHELVDAFEAVGLPLHKTLRQMLADAPAHCTVRRGCGLTQATRFLADFINTPRSVTEVDDLAIFADGSRRQARAVASRCLSAGWACGWRALDRAPDALREQLAGMSSAQTLQSLPERLHAVAGRVERVESQLLLGLIRDLLGCPRHSSEWLPPMANKPEIGSCSQAEEFFLQIAHDRIRRGGSVNIFVDAAMRPVLVEKINMGESHSAVLVKPAILHGVKLPPGTLTALRSHRNAKPLREHAHGGVWSLDDLAEVRFLRLTTLAVEPAHRRRAFSTQFERQLQANMMSPESTTIADLDSFAKKRIEAG